MRAQEIIAHTRHLIEERYGDIDEEQVTLYCHGCGATVAVEYDLSAEIEQHLDGCPSHPNDRPYVWPVFTLDYDVAVTKNALKRSIDLTVEIDDDTEDP